MHTSLVQGEHPPEEAMADVPGVCELPLTRAIVQYRDVHEVEPAGGRIQDIGLGLVLEGRYASSSEVVDLGSGDVKRLNLSAELVVLDWIYEPTLEHVHALVRASAGARSYEGGGTGDERRALERFCFRIALRVLERVGFGPLTRATLLRIGFRDVCRDLDLHDATSVRVSLPGGRIARAHLDYDGNALLFRTPTADPDPALESALGTAFPGGELRRLVPASEAASGGYQIRFPLPLDLEELREELRGIRAGLAHLLTRFEPERFRQVERLVDTFGERETLARLELRSSRVRWATVPRIPPGLTVH